MAKPNEGKWSSLDPVEYKINEHRYADTGKKFISIDWFILPDMLFSLSGCDVDEHVSVDIIHKTEQVKHVYYSYATLGDCNPWD